MTRPEQALLPCPIEIPDSMVDKVVGFMTAGMDAGCNANDARAIWKLVLSQIAGELAELWNRREAILSRAATTQAGETILRTALQRCAEVFHEYEAIHAAKPDEAKALRNRQMALMCEAALSVVPSQPVTPVVADGFDFRAHLQRQREWSELTFGPGMRTAGVCDHIRKELCEVEADPSDMDEWIDVVILALDGAWRCGGSPEQIIAGIVAKQTKNEGRTWPDWRTMPADKAIEHVKSGKAND